MIIQQYLNPFAGGTPTEITNKIIGIFDFSDDHYKPSSTRFLQLLVRLLNALNIPITFHNLIFYGNLDNINLQPQQPKKTDDDSLPSFDAPKNDFKGVLSDEKLTIKRHTVAF